MGPALRSFALLLALVLIARSAAADPEVEELLKTVREKVAANARRMPRYTCVETISRAQYEALAKGASCQSMIARRRLMKSPAGSMFERDRLRLDVAVVNGSEMFSWAGAGKFETHEIDRIVGGGASGSGDFGSFLASVFGEEPDMIRFRGLEHDLAVFEYNVPLARSSYRYHTTRKDKTLGFNGTFAIDPTDKELAQLTVETDQFAPGESACRVEHTMDYQRVNIGNGDFLLPEVSTMKVLYQTGAESLNETRYSECREYVGESTIRFDDVDPVAPQSTSKAAQQPLPPKVRLQIGLQSPIDSETAAAGDAITGIVLRDAHKNDIVHGRILRLEQFLFPAQPRWVIAIRFDSIAHNGVEQPLDLPAQTFTFAQRGKLMLDQKFHSDWLTR
jgi:hypothetical protein